VRAFLDESAPDYVLYVERHGSAPFAVVHESAGYVGERYSVPEHAAELFPADLGAAEVRAKVLLEVGAALAKVKMSKAARTAVDAVLVDLGTPDD